MGKKLFLLLIPPVMICCVLVGYLFPLSAGAVYVSGSPIGSSPAPISLSSLPSHINSVKININTASHTVLTQLPGIGSVIAHRIINYRNVSHKFGSIEEIQSVKGIGEEIYNNIRLLICTE